MKLYFILSSIYYFSEVNHLKNIKYLKRHSKFWKRMVGDRFYPVALRYLEKEGVIEIDDSYSKNHYTKGYRICAKFSPREILWELRTFHYPRLAAKMAGRKNGRSGKKSHDTKYLDEPAVEAGIPDDSVDDRGKTCPVDVASPQGWIYETFEKHTSFPPEANYVAGALEDNRFTLARFAMEAVEEGCICWKKGLAESGRLYYPFASCASEVRKLALIDGERTVEVDIASSQPFFAATLYEANEPEKERFLLTIREGGFYSAIEKRLSKVPDRDELKEAVFGQWLYGGIYTRREVYEAIWGLFPKLCEALDKAYPPRRKKNPALARHLQKMEADCVFNTVQKLRNLGIRCLSVHDSLVVPERFEPWARKLLAESIMERTGMQPVLK